MLVQMEFILVVAANYFVPHHIVRLLGVRIVGFHKRGQREIPQVRRQYKLIDGLLEYRRIVVDIDDFQYQRHLGAVAGAVVVARLHIQMVLGHHFPVEAMIVRGNQDDPVLRVQVQRRIQVAQNLGVANAAAKPGVHIACMHLIEERTM